jgi:hypothetical protein
MSCDRSAPITVATPAAHNGSSLTPVPAPTSSTHAPDKAAGDRSINRAAIGA